MWLMLQQEKPDDYVSHSRPPSVRHFCELAFAHVGLEYRKHVVTRDELKRPAEVDFLQATPARRSGASKWEPSVTLEDLVAEMVEADLKRHRQT